MKFSARPTRQIQLYFLSLFRENIRRIFGFKSNRFPKQSVDIVKASRQHRLPHSASSLVALVMKFTTFLFFIYSSSCATCLVCGAGARFCAKSPDFCACESLLCE